jgi:hypothetical protein
MSIPALLLIHGHGDKNTPGNQIKELMRIANESGAVNVIFWNLSELPFENQSIHATPT